MYDYWDDAQPWLPQAKPGRSTSIIKLIHACNASLEHTQRLQMNHAFLAASCILLHPIRKPYPLPVRLLDRFCSISLPQSTEHGNPPFPIRDAAFFPKPDVINSHGSIRSAKQRLEARGCALRLRRSHHKSRIIVSWWWPLLRATPGHCRWPRVGERQSDSTLQIIIITYWCRRLPRHLLASSLLLHH